LLFLHFIVVVNRRLHQLPWEKPRWPWVYVPLLYSANTANWYRRHTFGPDEGRAISDVRFGPNSRPKRMTRSHRYWF